MEIVVQRMEELAGKASLHDAGTMKLSATDKSLVLHRSVSAECRRTVIHAVRNPTC